MCKYVVCFARSVMTPLNYCPIDSALSSTELSMTRCSSGQPSAWKSWVIQFNIFANFKNSQNNFGIWKRRPFELNCKCSWYSKCWVKLRSVLYSANSNSGDSGESSLALSELALVAALDSAESWVKNLSGNMALSWSVNFKGIVSQDVRGLLMI